MTSSPHEMTMRRLATASALAAVIALSGCATGPRLVTPKPPAIPEAGPPVPGSVDAVLQNGQQVVGTSAAGKMKIEAGPGLRRVFDWDGLRRGAIVQARTTPFANGKTDGLTFDGTPKVWADANGITKLRYEEGERHFENKSDALIWMQIRRLYFVYNDQGLVLGWAKNGDTLHVELWQFYIDGKKPTSMPDSRDSDITLGKLVVEPQKMSPQLVFSDGHTEPYNTETASQYKGAGTSSQSQPAESCSWFARLFHQCQPKRAAASNETTTSASGNAAAPATPASKSASGAAAAQPAAGTSTSTSGSQSASSAGSSPATPKGPTATIAGDTVNIRSKPSTHSDVLMQAHKDDAVVILKQDRGWRYVQFKNGKKGWVANFLLKH